MRDINYKKDEWSDFVPEAYDNRVDSDPVSMKVHWLSGEEYRKYRKMTVFKQKHGDLQMNTEDINRKILAANVKEVKNYSINGRAIESGEDFYRFAEPDFIDELLDVVTNLSRLEAGSQDSLSSQSALS